MLLKVQFVSKAWPDIRRKWERLEDWQEKGINDLLKEALKVYLRREEEKARNKARMMAVARESIGVGKEMAEGMGSPNPPSGRKAPVAPGRVRPRRPEDLKRYYCGEAGHFKRDCKKAAHDEAIMREQEALEKL